MSVRESVYRLVSNFFGIDQSALAVPVLAGPGRGLWFRQEPTSSGEPSKDTRVFVSSPRTENLAKQIPRGWTIWDCSGEAGVSTILFSRFVGQEGLVVAFEPERRNFMRTYDNATLNGCNNIFFLFASIGEPMPKKSFMPPVCARQFSLDEAYQDGEIPIPQLIRLDLSGTTESALQHCRQLVSEQRPLIVIDKYKKESEKTLRAFAAEYRYTIQSLESGESFDSASSAFTGSLLLRPQEKV